VLAQSSLTSAIVGASKAEQFKDTLGALEVKLDQEEMEFCNSIWFRLPRASDPKYALR
jgi:1-deoxyxylulose-5-phosphate synthase